MALIWSKSIGIFQIILINESGFALEKRTEREIVQ